MNRGSTIISLVSVLVGSTIIFGCDAFRTSDVQFLKDPGPILFISHESGSDQLYSMNSDGSGVKQLTDNNRNNISDAHWSPDGHWIMLGISPVTEMHEADQRFVRITAVDGSRSRDCRGIIPAYLVWSPDSNMFLQGGVGPDRDAEIVDINTCLTSPFNAVLRERRTDFSDWSANNHTILGHTTFTKRDADGHIAQHHIRTSLWTTLGDTTYTIGKPGDRYMNAIWANNEAYIAVGIRREKDESVYRMSLDGGDLLQLTDDQYWYAEPIEWSADDAQILVHAKSRPSPQRPSLSKILIVDANGGRSTDISPFPHDNNRPTSWRTNW